MHFVRIMQLLQMGRSKEAEEIARDWITKEPNEANAFFWLARTLTNQSRYREALDVIKAGLDLDAMNGDAHYIHAEILFHMGKHRAALKELETAIEIDPDDEHYLILMGYILLNLGKRPKALEAANRALALDPESTDALQLRAAILARMNKAEAAEEDMNLVFADAADDDSAHMTQGWNCLLGGSYDRARTHFAEALRIDPTNESARLGLLETFKARSVVYRVLFGFLLWYTKLPTMWQLGVLGGFLFLRDDIPVWIGMVFRSVAVYLIVDYTITLFLILLLAKDAIFNLVIYSDPATRVALNDMEKRGVAWSAPFLLLILGAAVARFFTGSMFFILHMLLGSVGASVMTEIHQLRNDKSRREGWIGAGVITALGIVFTVGYYTGLPESYRWFGMCVLGMLLVSLRLDYLSERE